MGSLGTPAPVRLAILETDTPVPGIQAKYGSYGGVFTHLFERACGALDPPQPLPSQLQLSFHDVVHDPTSHPDPESIDAVLITGSKASAFENVDWIVRLVQYVKLLLEGGRVRVIGVCFGHQIVGRALGAKVDRSVRGWELSVVEVDLTEEGKQFFGLEKMVSHSRLAPAPTPRPLFFPISSSLPLPSPPISAMILIPTRTSTSLPLYHKRSPHRRIPPFFLPPANQSGVLVVAQCRESTRCTATLCSSCPTA